MNEETMNAAQGEVTVDELEENLTESPQQEENAQDEQEAMIAEIRAGLGELFEDGWSPQEMGAFTQDEAVRSDIAQGKSVARAACAYRGERPRTGAACRRRARRLRAALRRITASST